MREIKFSKIPWCVITAIWIILLILKTLIEPDLSEKLFAKGYLVMLATGFAIVYAMAYMFFLNIKLEDTFRQVKKRLESLDYKMREEYKETEEYQNYENFYHSYLYWLVYTFISTVSIAIYCFIF